MISVRGLFWLLKGCVALVLILAHLLDHKEHDGATELKIVLDILVRGSENLYGCLVQRIIKALSHL